MYLTGCLIFCACGILRCTSNNRFFDPSLQWRHDESDSVSNYQPHDYLLNRLFCRRAKKTSKLRVTGICARNSPETGDFPAQRASNAENVSIWWCHYVQCVCGKSGVILIESSCVFVFSIVESHFFRAWRSLNQIMMPLLAWPLSVLHDEKFHRSRASDARVLLCQIDRCSPRVVLVYLFRTLQTLYRKWPLTTAKDLTRNINLFIMNELF